MAEIVICEFMDETAVDWLRQRSDVFYDPGLVFDEPRLHAEVETARGLIVRSSAQVDQRLLDAGAKLEVVGRLGVGLERFDLNACAARGVTVLKADGANALSVVEYTMTVAATLLRRIAYHSTAEVIAGAWPRQQSIGQELAGKTLGIIGLGQIGRLVAARAVAIGMTVLASDPYIAEDDEAWALAERCDLNDVLELSDVITLHVPLTNETLGMIGTDTIGRMKPDTILINSARGKVVDEAAVGAALRAGRLGGAAIDVFAEEPLTAEGRKRFEGLQNVILTPHIAGVTVESNRRVSQMTAENVYAALR